MSERETRDETSVNELDDRTVDAETLRDQTVLVTGGGGFIGGHLVRELVDENDVRVLDNFSTGSRDDIPDGVEVIEGDVRDSEALSDAMAGVDVAFHTAAVVSVERSVEDPRTCHETNATATLDILERARVEDARVVLSSSCAIYGHPETVPIPESAPKQPTSPYGLDKLAADEYVRLYHELYGVEAVALRYFNVYGPGQRAGDYCGVIAAFIRQLRDGGPITIDGDGEQTRDFVHVRDVVRANLRAATTSAVGEAYNVGTGDSITVRGLAELLRDLTGVDADIVHTDPRSGDIRASRADISLARKNLGYEPRVSLDDGLGTLLG